MNADAAADANAATADSRAAISSMIASWTDVPALVCDRHLTVVAANTAARALSAAFTEGVNLARFTFLDADIDRDRAMYDTAATQVAALLRESLDQHEGDPQFAGIVGDLSVLSVDFAGTWADDSLSARASGVVDFTDTPIGLVQMGYQLLRVPGDADDSLLVWSPVSESSAAAFARLLASARERFSATPRTA